jgi:hypothetical protein
MDVAKAQADLRRSYVGGGPGAIVSGCVWFAVAAVAARNGISTAFTVLFFGGMLIFPLSTLIARLLFRRAKEASGNPLGLTALESTIAMIGGLIAAWLFLPSAPQFVFPLSAVAVGTHYLVFKTAYGDRTYWVLGAAITFAGLLDVFSHGRLPGNTILTVGMIEVLFGALLTWRERATHTP